jgi:putative N6-adenine-specific DNA methylase
MQETLAAALLRLTGWAGERPLYDPFCGSGTLLFEALMRQCRIPAAYLRSQFGFLRLPDFDAAVWNQVKTAANAAIRPLPEGLIGGSDVSPEAVRAVRSNRSALPDGERIKVRRADFEQLGGLQDTLILTNPPHGIRLGDAAESADLLKRFGDFLKQHCTGSTAYVFYGDKALVKKLGLKPEWKHPLQSGGLDGVLCKYELY